MEIEITRLIQFEILKSDSSQYSYMFIIKSTFIMKSNIH